MTLADQAGRVTEAIRPVCRSLAVARARTSSTVHAGPSPSGRSVSGSRAWSPVASAWAVATTSRAGQVRVPDDRPHVEPLGPGDVDGDRTDGGVGDPGPVSGAGPRRQGPPRPVGERAPAEGGGGRRREGFEPPDPAGERVREGEDGRRGDRDGVARDEPVGAVRRPGIRGGLGRQGAPGHVTGQPVEERPERAGQQVLPGPGGEGVADDGVGRSDEPVGDVNGLRPRHAEGGLERGQGRVTLAGGPGGGGEQQPDPER